MAYKPAKLTVKIQIADGTDFDSPSAREIKLESTSHPEAKVQTDSSLSTHGSAYGGTTYPEHIYGFMVVNKNATDADLNVVRWYVSDAAGGSLVSDIDIPYNGHMIAIAGDPVVLIDSTNVRTATSSSGVDADWFIVGTDADS